VGFAIFGLAFMHIQLLLLAGVLWAMATAELRNAQGAANQSGTMWSDASGGPRANPRTGAPMPVPKVVIVRRRF
jgi:hypothetical protein